MTASEVAKLKAERRAALQDAIAVLDAKPKHFLFDGLRREFAAVLKVFDAEDALKSDSPATLVAATPALAEPIVKPNARGSLGKWVKSTLARCIGNASKSTTKS